MAQKFFCSFRESKEEWMNYTWIGNKASLWEMRKSQSRTATSTHRDWLLSGAQAAAAAVKENTL
jgi:hypothetical protein